MSKMSDRAGDIVSQEIIRCRTLGGDHKNGLGTSTDN